MPLEKLYSVEEAATYLRVSKWTIHAWLAQKRLRKTKIGARTVIRESDIEAFVKSQNPTLPRL